MSDGITDIENDYYNDKETQDWMNAPLGKPKPANEGQHETVVIKLLREYFENYDAMKKIKRERINYLDKNECKDGCLRTSQEQQIPVDIEYVCDICKQRNEFYLRLKQLRYRNVALKNSMRAKVL